MQSTCNDQKVTSFTCLTCQEIWICTEFRIYNALKPCYNENKNKELCIFARTPLNVHLQVTPGPSKGSSHPLSLKFWDQKLFSISLVLLHKVEIRAGDDHRIPQLQVLEDVLVHLLHGLELLLDNLSQSCGSSSSGKTAASWIWHLLQHQGKCYFWPKPIILKCSAKALVQIK